MLNIWQKNLRGEYIFFYFILAALDLVEGFESFFPRLHPGFVLNQKQKIGKELFFASRGGYIGRNFLSVEGSNARFICEGDLKGDLKEI